MMIHPMYYGLLYWLILASLNLSSVESFQVRQPGQSLLQKDSYYSRKISPLASPIIQRVSIINGDADNLDEGSISSKSYLKQSDDKIAGIGGQGGIDNLDEGSISSKSYLKQSDDKIAGIGGQGGMVYDVNKVKRNLVQEAMRAYKMELLDLLGTPLTKRKKTNNVDSPAILWPGVSLEDFIEAKISALVEVNPVTTTTDSNLLEGRWELAYEANNATAVLQNPVPLFSSRTEFNSAKQLASKQRRAASSYTFLSSIIPPKSGVIFKSCTRQFYLEQLDDTEDAYVEDLTIRFGGLFVIQRKYDISKLTRTSLDLQLRACNADICYGAASIPLRRQNNNERTDDDNSKKRLNMSILYLDSDLCICLLMNDSFDPTVGRFKSTSYEGSLQVYTKSEKWVKDRNIRKVRFFLAVSKWISTVRSPFQIRYKISRWFGEAKEDNTRDTGKIFFKKDLGTSQVKVIKFGNTVNNVEDCWESDEDPFITLDPELRQALMKNMKLSEIEEVGRNYKSEATKRNKKIIRRPGQLKKPPPSR